MQSIDYKSFSGQLNGLWDAILSDFGIEVGNFKGLNTKNSACPLCGGSDRAHWREQGGRLSLYCRHCTDGSMKSAEDVIMEATGITYNDLVNSLSKFANNVPMEVIHKAKVKHQATPKRNMPIDHKQDHLLVERFIQKCEQCHSMRLLSLNAPNPQKLYVKNDIDYWGISNDEGVMINLAKIVDGEVFFIAGGQSYGAMYTIAGSNQSIIVVDPVDGILCWYKTQATIHIAFTLENMRWCLRNRKDINPVVCVRDDKNASEFNEDHSTRILTGDGYNEFKIIKGEE